MSNMMSDKEFCKEHREAMARAMKKALRSKKASTALLIRAGILEKNGKRLAKPYR